MQNLIVFLESIVVNSHLHWSRIFLYLSHFMGFRISNIHAYNRFIAIDLGSYRIRSALYHISDGKIELEWYASVRQSRKNILNGSIVDMQWVAQTIEKSIHEACKWAQSIPEEIIIGFSPVVCIGDSISSQYIRHDPTEPLSMDELDVMIEKIEKTSLLRVKNRAKSEFAIIHDDIRLISSTITSIMIDGNAVVHPLWQKGQHIRITVLNVYTLASEYNILRSIVSSLGKNTISIVPIPVILPKIVERSWKNYENALYIDIGYTHMTVVSVENHEIQYFETFSVGSKMLMEILSGYLPNMSFTEIESLMMRERAKSEDAVIRSEAAGEYVSYVIDTFLSVIQREKDNIREKALIVSGWIFQAKWLLDLFYNQLEHFVGEIQEKHQLASLIEDDSIPPDYVIPIWLSELGQELLHIKKDPIIRILRYTLYHYE